MTMNLYSPQPAQRANPAKQKTQQTHSPPQVNLRNPRPTNAPATQIFSILQPIPAH
ncbi:hypothetical protein P280DRAFT_470114 [Massarina eburnea CBS 473.64]|uniref:Uncharacterized protein n=1 Tax=Massarina eburnea CBS 473.64 TaxID=1395130 RepID=A0A6A6RZP4_9PLEO|nr:hypothetical protein P280DRAFT_470114 [Massarina eburnea CBS 473.64]